MEYHKIQTLFERGEDFNVIVGKFKNPVYSIIKSWVCTEKIDGTNIRIILNEDGTVNFNGRTDNAQLNGQLVMYLQKTFNSDLLKQVLWLPEKDGRIIPKKCVLYGEGYGSGIQKVGVMYNKNKVFRLFDVLIDKYWLSQQNVNDIADKLSIKTAPYLGEMSLEQIIDKVKSGFNSIVAMEDNDTILQSEGIVARTIEPLFDKCGDRVILKLKTCDFNHVKKGG